MQVKMDASLIGGTQLETKTFFMLPGMIVTSSTMTVDFGVHPESLRL